MLETMSSGSWEHFEHKADIGIRGYGDSVAVAFEQAGLAMTAVVTDLARVRASETVSVSCSDSDNDSLLYDWLNALIYEMATRKMLFSEFKVAIDDGRLSATAAGEPIDVERHRPSVEIKGATFTELGVYRQDHRWVAQCVIDV